jgi:hypothetical protein
LPPKVGPPSTLRGSPARYTQCVAGRARGTPPEWNVTVAEGGAKFLSSGGTEYTDGPKAINVQTGSPYTFVSADAIGDHSSQGERIRILLAD